MSTAVLWLLQGDPRLKGKTWLPELRCCRGSVAAAGPRLLGDLPPQAPLSSPAFPWALGLGWGGGPWAAQAPPAAGGGRIQPPASGPWRRSRGGRGVVVRSFPRILSPARRAEPRPLAAMRRGRAPGAWALLASLAVASWAVRGESPGIALCRRAAAVLSPVAETGTVARGDPRRGAPKGPRADREPGARPVRCSGPAAVAAGLSPWSLATATRAAAAAGVGGGGRVAGKQAPAARWGFPSRHLGVRFVDVGGGEGAVGATVREDGMALTAVPALDHRCGRLELCALHRGHLRWLRLALQRQST